MHLSDTSRKDGTKITFEREGDEAPGTIPADIVFVVQTKPHPIFTREGDDLICKVSFYSLILDLFIVVISCNLRSAQ